MARPGLGRLRKGPEFDGVYREGTVLNGPLFVLRVRANTKETNRWGFAVGKRLAPKAVERNLVRRRLREAARQIESLAAPVGEAGVDVILTAKSQCLRASVQAMVTELSRLMEQTPTGAHG